MAVKAINTPLSNYAHSRQQQQKNGNTPNNNQPSFQGMGNPFVMLMDAIERGGFAASFIAQDGIGMVAPRIREGLNRGRETDENGKKHGPLNWEFARKEGVREILSGPSAFLIPAGMLFLIKKYSGTANNVSVDVIKSLGQKFEKYADKNPYTLTDVAKTKKEYYNNIFKEVLNATTEGKLSPDEIARKAENYTAKTIEIENSKSKGFFRKLFDIKVTGSQEDLTQALTDDFMMLKKQHLDPSIDNLIATLPIEGRKEPVEIKFKKLLESMKNYSDDVTKSLTAQLEKDQATNVAEFVKNHTSRRIGSRFVSIFSMFAAVVGFYTIIPKLYNLGLKGNPALKNQELSQKQTTEKADNKVKETRNGKNIPFEGAGIQKALKNTGDAVMNKSWLKKLTDKFEFDGASMSVPAMLTLLFAFCLPPRYFQAQDDYDKKEILVRDISSFAAILFGAKALSRGCSVAFSKLSGLALNTKPADHAKSFLHKLKNYFTAGSGINVLTSEAIVSKYTNIDKYPGGINGFFDFIEKNDGNIKKMLKLDKTVKANAEAIIGKPIKNATIDEIKTAFKNVKNTEALENIYKVFRNVDGNKYVSYAKAMNSFFGALSTLALVPAFMIWLARYCDRMTKKNIARDNAIALQPQQQPQPVQQQTHTQQVKPVQESSYSGTVQDYRMQRPTMAGFIK